MFDSFLNLLRRLRNNNVDLLKIGTFSVISTVIKSVSFLGITKIASVYLGVAQFSIFYQFISIITIFTLCSTGAIDSGITKFTAEYAHDSEKLRVFSAACRLITIVFATLTALSLLIFADFWSIFFYNNSQYGSYLQMLGAVIGFTAIYKYQMAVLNGEKKYGVFYQLDAIQNMVILGICLMLMPFFKLTGSITAYLLAPFFTLLIGYVFLKKHFKSPHLGSISVIFNQLRYDLSPENIKKQRPFSRLFSFSAYSFLGLLMGPYIEILIRQSLISSHSVEYASIWDGLNRINGLFSVFTITLINTFVIPHFAALKQNASVLSRELLRLFLVIIPPFIVVALGVYLLREWFVLTFFSPAFLPLTALMGIQLLGCLVSVINMVFTNFIISRYNPLFVVPYNILASLSYYFLISSFTLRYGYQGLPLAYLINSLIGVFLLVIIIILVPRFQRKSTL